MTKSEMMLGISSKISELETEYRKYIDLDNGPSKSYSGANCMRSRIEKDLSHLRLIRKLLECANDDLVISEPVLVKDFTRVTAPRRKKK